MKLLLVEDDAKLVRALERGLGREGYAIDVARDGHEALEQAGAREYDAIVLDVMLPGPDGFAVCETLRMQGSRTPVLMLTARADVRDRIRGLNGGADDYLVKPFDFGELVARLRALTRRSPAAPAHTGAVTSVGELHIDAERSVVTRAGSSVELSARELAVLQCLARQPGRVVSRSELLEEVWGAEFDRSSNLVDVYVGYLRKKLERPFGRPLIRTVRGTGFLLESD
ncbi:MAG TPA: response regulator transcription factor [Solirubrobacteraceae bacterium]|nr:response regulator transcription factor [Solirubrobacteraceae bacterium]